MSGGGGTGEPVEAVPESPAPSWGAGPAASENPNPAAAEAARAGHFDLQDATGCTAQGLSSGVRGARGLGEGPGTSASSSRGVTPASLITAVSCEAEKPGFGRDAPGPGSPHPLLSSWPR